MYNVFAVPNSFSTTYNETDFCLGETMLREYYCMNDYWAATDTDCAIGYNTTCSQGACI